jgi:predicted nicotinamide N-methyase
MPTGRCILCTGPRKLLKRLATDPDLSESTVADQVLDACTQLTASSSSGTAGSGLTFSQDFAEVLHRDELYPDVEIRLCRPLTDERISEDAARKPLRHARARAAIAFVPSACSCVMQARGAGVGGAPSEVLIKIASSSRRSRIGSEIECKVWPAAVMLSRWLWCHDYLVAGMSVLEIGAGVGVAGLAAARCGAAEVVLTDINRTALQLARANATKSASPNVSIRVCHLDWFAPPILDVVEQGSSNAAGDVATSDEQRLRSSFDVILAADVVNAEGLSPMVVRMIHLYLNDDGLFLMICPLAKHRFMVDELRALLLADSALEVHIASVPEWLWAGIDEADVVSYELFVVQKKLGAARGSE